MEKKRDMTTFTTFGLYLVILILVILVGQNLFFRLDLTANGLYSLSKASKKAVSTLNEPMTINVFFSKNLPAPYNNIERYLHDLLDEYGAHARKNLSYRFFNVSAKESELSEEAEENRQMAQDYGIYPVNVQTIEQDEAKVQRAYMGMAFVHGDIIERLPALTSTEGLEYQITSTIQKMNNKISALLNLPEKIRVKLVQSSSLTEIAPQVGLEGLEGLKDRVAEVVEAQNEKTYGQLEFITMDPSLQQVPEEELAPYRRFGLQWPEFTRPDGSVSPADSGYLGLGMEFGGKSVEMQLLSSSLNLTSQGLQEQFVIVEGDQLESFIEENVDNLINIHEEIGYLSTHGTQALAGDLPPQLQMMQQQVGSLTQFNALLSERYTINQIDMTENGIPDSVDTLIIAGPKQNFSEWELLQIDQFLMKGKSLALFLDAFNEIRPQQQQQMYGMQQPAYLPLNTGLEKLLDHYGASIRKSYVMDESCYVSRDQQMGETPIYFAPIIKNENINHRLDFLSNVKELIMYRVSPVVLDEERLNENGLDATQMMATTGDAWEMAGQINLTPFMIRPPMNPDEKSQHALAYILEGEFPSYFADRPIPDKPDPVSDEPDNLTGEEIEDVATTEEKPEEKPARVESQVTGEKGVLTKGRPGRIFLISSSEILTDNILGQQGQSPNSVFLLNTIDFLNDQEDIAVMRGKNQRFNPLKDTKAFTRTLVKVVNIAGLPALLVLCGIYVWFRRKARRKTIQAMFSSGKA